MKLVAAVVAVLMVLAVACGSSAASQSATKGGGDTPSNISATVVGQQSQVDVLTQRVAELESHLDALSWTEEEAIAVVKHVFEGKLEACGLQHSHTFLDYGITKEITQAEGCVPGYFQTPVLRAFQSWSIIPRQAPGLGGVMIAVGEWSAIYDSEDIRWRVTVIHQFTDRPVSLAFYVYENTGLVVGVPSS